MVEYYADSPDAEARRLAVIATFLKHEGFKKEQVIRKNVRRSQEHRQTEVGDYCLKKRAGGSL